MDPMIAVHGAVGAVALVAGLIAVSALWARRVLRARGLV